ncbi:MAG: hypothetical protein IJQ95_01070 [Paludibacteraceae bacterium]|nr:hypothetical protein [Paludibacteraceae bacterium]MBR0295971.1 hypothetical protein [Paludibacteraceae bacterium]
MYIAIVVLLLVFGVLLLLAEMFLLPGFGIAGISGFGCLIGSVVVAYLKLTPCYPWAGHVTLAAALVLTGLAIYAFLRGRAIDKMALDAQIDSKVELAEPGKKINNLKKEAEAEEKK